MIEQGMQVFYRNNKLAGEASVLHAAQSAGMLLYGKKAAVIGRGNTAQGAIRALTCNGASVTVYGRQQEDKFRTDHIISRDSLKAMKRNALLLAWVLIDIVTSD